MKLIELWKMRCPRCGKLSQWMKTKAASRRKIVVVFAHNVGTHPKYGPKMGAIIWQKHRVVYTAKVQSSDRKPTV